MLGDAAVSAERCLARFDTKMARGGRSVIDVTNFDSQARGYLSGIRDHGYSFSASGLDQKTFERLHAVVYGERPTGMQKLVAAVKAYTRRALARFWHWLTY